MSVPNLERAVIEVIGSCNYACTMCPQSTGREPDFLRKMPLDVFEAILDQLPGNPVINLEGSGEPTLAKDLPLYVEACSRRGLKSIIYTNGSRLCGSLMHNIIDAGISLIRVSCIGYNAELYNQWMCNDNFDLIKDNVRNAINYVRASNSKCAIASYHLILDPNRVDYEIEKYRSNFIEELGTIGYIWKMHNWSGNYSPIYFRDSRLRKTCGRPFAPEVTIRAGGLDGKYGAVTPCCQVLGPPNESSSVLGHLSTESLEDIWTGSLYSNLREAHLKNDFNSILYCKNCDFLYEDSSILAWSNDPNADTDYMLGTSFNLRTYK